jgi:hypothetical protein
MTCLKCKHVEAKRFGFYGRKRIQRYRCPGCNATFSEPRKRPLGRHYTGPDKAAQIATLWLEGMSVCAVSRITRFQLTTDGLRSYVPAVEEYFGADIDFAQLLKLYGTSDGEGPDWYQPSKVTATIPAVITGDPDESRISTSHVERANLSVRTHLRRFTRLSLGFSKSLDHLKAAIALYMAFFNFVRVHQTLRVTPAMHAGLTDHIWTVQELLEAQ